MDAWPDGARSDQDAIHVELQVQSRCFDVLYSQQDENVVVAAPTSSGKTVLFELGCPDSSLRPCSTHERRVAAFSLYIDSVLAIR